MKATRTATRNKAAILVAPEFNEESTIQCLCQMRQKGLAVDLVGTMAGVFKGLHGIAICPDISLSQLAESVATDFQLLVFPDGGKSIAALLSDPRVHELIVAVLNQGGFVAAMSPAVRQILATVGVLTPEHASHFLSRGNSETVEFVQELLGHVPA